MTLNRQKIYFEKDKKNKITRTRYNQVDVVVMVESMRKSFIVFVLTQAHIRYVVCVCDIVKNKKEIFLFLAMMIGAGTREMCQASKKKATRLSIK